MRPNTWRRFDLSRLVVGAVLAASAAAGATAQEAPGETSFDAARAFADARTMVELGPRPLGSEALERNRAFIEAELRASGLEPWRDEFDADTPIGVVPMANIVATVPAASGTSEGRRIVLASHFDTKLFEGIEFVGANDGASSTAVLLELGRVLAAEPLEIPVDLVFFDGEEAVVSWTDTDSIYGSRNLVDRWFLEDRLDDIGAVVLLDMVGDADLQIQREINSSNWLTEVIWQAAADLGLESHFPDTYHAIMDDHLPFIDAGVDAIDLIDFSYGPGNRYWHSPFDTFDKLSADSLEIVGRVVLQALPEIVARVQSRS
jgi:hypothetical protein